MVGLPMKRSGDSLMPMRHLRVAALLVLSPTDVLYGRTRLIAGT